MAYSPRVEEALTYAGELHRQQHRKGSGIPYVTHLWSVAALVGEAGGSEDEVIAALLHDAAEDQGGETTLAEIRERFGAPVADLVAGCSDTFEHPKPPWQQRKEDYLAELATAPDGVLRISCADKLHNVRSILADLREIGDDVWQKFTGGRDRTLWYYRELLQTYRQRKVSARLVDELDRAVHAMHELAGVPL